MDYPMQYPKYPDLADVSNKLRDFAALKFEYGACSAEIQSLLDGAHKMLAAAVDNVLALPDDAVMAKKEPNDIEEIVKLRPKAGRTLWDKFDRQVYKSRLAGAFTGRMAGCTLGAPVEFWSVEAMRDWAEYIGDQFPPVNYWSSIKHPNDKRYEVSRCYEYTRPGLNGVPVDDDITYTLLGLLMAEDAGLDFTYEDVGRLWLKYLPYACTAEDVALKNLKAGVAAKTAADPDNPYVQWIGADIRSDPWGYLAPGLPEKAARMAWNDAWISHRRNGIYGEMYFSAVISAAFACDNPITALEAGLNEIPAECLLAGDIRWALDKRHDIRNHAQARKAVEDRFGAMGGVHTNLNACLTIFGLHIGGDSFTKCIGETVAMGYDNDCTAATVGSIFGAAKGIENIPGYWYEAFNNRVLSYINGHPSFEIDDVLRRFEVLAEKNFC